MGMGYSAGHSTPAGTDLTIIVLESAAAVRGTIEEFVVGSITAPADEATEFNLLRHTTAGITGTNVVEKEHDEDNVGASCSVQGGTFGTEPVYETDELYNVPVNQRATFRWVARPGKGFKTTVGTANGIGLRSISSTATPTINASLSWVE